MVLKRKYFFSKNVHSYRVCSFKAENKKDMLTCSVFNDLILMFSACDQFSEQMKDLPKVRYVKS